MLFSFLDERLARAAADAAAAVLQRTEPKIWLTFARSRQPPLVMLKLIHVPGEMYKHTHA
jgi:hypothetical protein